MTSTTSPARRLMRADLKASSLRCAPGAPPEIAWAARPRRGRQFLILGLATWGLVRFSIRWLDSPRRRPGFRRVQLHGAPARVVHHSCSSARALAPSAARLLYACERRVRGAVPRAGTRSHGAGIGRGRSEASSLSRSATPGGTSSCIAPGAVSDLLRRRGARRAYPLICAAASCGSGAWRWPSMWRDRGPRWMFGAGAAVRVHVVPVFFVFPVAFTLTDWGSTTTSTRPTRRSGAR